MLCFQIQKNRIIYRKSSSKTLLVLLLVLCMSSRQKLSCSLSIITLVLLGRSECCTSSSIMFNVMQSVRKGWSGKRSASTPLSHTVSSAKDGCFNRRESWPTERSECHRCAPVYSWIWISARNMSTSSQAISHSGGERGWHNKSHPSLCSCSSPVQWRTYTYTHAWSTGTSSVATQIYSLLVEERRTTDSVSQEIFEFSISWPGWEVSIACRLDLHLYFKLISFVQKSSAVFYSIVLTRLHSQDEHMFLKPPCVIMSDPEPC